MASAALGLKRASSGGLAASAETRKTAVHFSLSDEGKELLRQGHGVEKVRLQRGLGLVPEMRIEGCRFHPRHTAAQKNGDPESAVRSFAADGVSRKTWGS